MNRTTLAACAVAILFGLSSLHADPSTYEYKVASTEFAAFFLDKSSEPVVKKWAQKHRPKLYKLAFTEKKAEKKGDEGNDSLISVATLMGARADLYLDYYLNHQAEDGWEPFKVEEKMILLRRLRKRG